MPPHYFLKIATSHPLRSAGLRIAMSNDPGYRIIQGEIPTHEKIEAAKKEISAEDLRKFQESVSSLGFERLGWGRNSDVLLHDGLDLSRNEYLENLLRVPYQNAKIHMTDVVVWIRNPKPLQRLKAGRGRVFIYKTLEEPLGPHNGFFRIVERSHRMSPEQIISAPATDIHLKPGEVIILDGDLVIEYPQAGGGVGLLKCVFKG